MNWPYIEPAIYALWLYTAWFICALYVFDGKRRRRRETEHEKLVERYYAEKTKGWSL